MIPRPYKAECYICKDPEFAKMGLPLCYFCKKCGGHIAADDTVCDDCGFDYAPAPSISDILEEGPPF